MGPKTAFISCVVQRVISLEGVVAIYLVEMELSGKVLVLSSILISRISDTLSYT